MISILQATCYDTVPHTVMNTEEFVDAKYLVPAHAFDRAMPPSSYASFLALRRFRVRFSQL